MLSRIFLIVLFSAMIAFSQVPQIEPGVSHYLAIWRVAHYSDVRYKLNLTLEKMSPVLKGTIEIRVKVGAGTLLSPSARSADLPPIILDWRKIRGQEELSTVSNVSINGRVVQQFSPPGGDGDKSVPGPFEESNEHLIFRDGVVAGENVIKLDFTSPILTSGSAITRYVDKEDGAEYIYSLFVPSDASTAFPVFDQPDLKARFTLDLRMPVGWKAISNEKWNGMITVRQCENLPPSTTAANLLLLVPKDKKRVVKRTPPVAPKNTTETFDPCNINEFGFAETKPISTYVFAFAAGPFEAFEDKGGNLSGSEGALQGQTQTGTLPTGRVSASSVELSSHIYVRKSQAAKFKPHAADVFRLTREGVKYLETYFDYKFPWPKYDLVLIPEFPFGGMEHAGATFLRESSVIFPTEPTKGDYISRANLIFHETAHQWFGDTVTMKWFDDLWLKEGFAEFMAYKTLEKVMPEANAWKVFYERNKQAAYATDSTKGTTPIYQEIKNLSAAKSAYGNIVYRKAPSFLRQAEFYLGPDKFQTAVRSFLKKHEYSNAGWEDLVREFEAASGQELSEWAAEWVKQRGVSLILPGRKNVHVGNPPRDAFVEYYLRQQDLLDEKALRQIKSNVLLRFGEKTEVMPVLINSEGRIGQYWTCCGPAPQNNQKTPDLVFPNYQDYGYGVFLLDDTSRDYVLKNVQTEKDPFLRSMMYGALWDSVREGELDPKDYVELVVKNLPTESDENIVASILGRASTAMSYYMAAEGGNLSGSEGAPRTQAPSGTLPTGRVSAGERLEAVLIDRMWNASTLGQRITFYRAFLNVASTEDARRVLKEMLKGGNPSGSEGAPQTREQTGTLPAARVSALPLKTKDRFDIVTRLATLGDLDAPKLLADLEKTETSDDAKRYTYAAKAAFATKENREKFWNDFVNNKEISESWIEAAMGPFNSIRHDDLSLPYLQRALAELPNLKRDRKIFFVNGWLGAFIGGQKSEEALKIVNKFLADNPSLDNDLRLKILENVDLIERAVKIRKKFSHE